MTVDPALIEAAARTLRHRYVFLTRDEAEDAATTVCAVVTPLIRAGALGEAAKVAEDYGKRWTFVPAIIEVEAIAAAIRSLKEQP